MSFKVVRNQAGKVVAYGPNEESYQPNGIVEIHERQPSELLWFGMWQAIRNKRTEVQNSGVLVGGKWFHTDQISRSQQISLVLLGTDIAANLKWKTMDGTFVEMTTTLALEIVDAVMVKDTATFLVAEAHRAAMETCSAPLDYDFSTGWPAMFGE